MQPKLVRILSPLLTKYLDERNWREHRAARSWHASALGSSCYRRLYYSRKGLKPERIIKAQYSRDGDAGTALHEVYQTYLTEMGVLHEVEETSAANVYAIGGRKDGVSHGGEEFKRFVAPGEKGLLEIKTMKTEAWTEMPDHYKAADYNAQMQIYLQLDPSLVRGMLLCINRDDSRIKEFLVERDGKYGPYLLRRAAYLESCWQQGKVPVAEPSIKCNWCEYPTACDLDDIREVCSTDV